MRIIPVYYKCRQCQSYNVIATKARRYCTPVCARAYRYKLKALALGTKPRRIIKHRKILNNNLVS